jgi:hypothetical protein
MFERVQRNTNYCFSKRGLASCNTVPLFDITGAAKWRQRKLVSTVAMHRLGTQQGELRAEPTNAIQSPYPIACGIVMR